MAVTAASVSARRSIIRPFCLGLSRRFLWWRRQRGATWPRGEACLFVGRPLLAPSPPPAGRALVSTPVRHSGVPAALAPPLLRLPVSALRCLFVRPLSRPRHITGRERAGPAGPRTGDTAQRHEADGPTAPQRGDQRDRRPRDWGGGNQRGRRLGGRGCSRELGAPERPFWACGQLTLTWILADRERPSIDGWTPSVNQAEGVSRHL